jgi:hypothetical protein
VSFRYFQQPSDETQRKPVKPSQIISGGLPGSTVIRIGGDQNVKISGIDRTISVSTADSTIEVGNITDTGQTGIKIKDSSDFTRFRMTPTTWTWYDKTSNTARAIIDTSNDTFSMKVSQSGYDVTTATNDRLVFNSANNLFKIIKSDIIEVPVVPAGGLINTTTSIGISSTYTPMAIGTLLDGVDAFVLPVGRNGTDYSIYSYLDGGVIHVGILADNNVGVDAPAVDVRYYVLQETAV